jgi:hypothetical protein
MHAPLLRRLAAAFLMVVLGIGGPLRASAAIPSAYAPIVVQPTPTAQGVEFDLTPALQRARGEGKRLYVYLGAADCPFCHRYEEFLQHNAAALVPHFSRQYLVVDLRSKLSVKAAQLHLRVGASSLPYAAFQRSIGDERERQLVYPSVWLLDHNARPLMPMPAGTGTFETVPEQLEILQLEQ